MTDALETRHQPNRSCPEKPKLPSSPGALTCDARWSDLPQLVVYGLKVRKDGNTEEVRRELHRLGYKRPRTSQLLAECSQYPPRNSEQRERQTFQDRPPCMQQQLRYRI